jgi:hypothetical protein
MHIWCLQKIAPQEQSAQDILGAVVTSTTHEPAVEDEDDDYDIAGHGWITRTNYPPIHLHFLIHFL